MMYCAQAIETQKTITLPPAIAVKFYGGTKEFCMEYHQKSKSIRSMSGIAGQIIWPPPGGGALAEKQSQSGDISHISNLYSRR
ncbi:hypothetical protein [Actimicrobium antarcticum]|uniref:Uncharacterized protein n=1 Tax=Actimicrobium antarcticum TaxID=1051899 RepID=A0ABP7TDC7_9BURK